jgi:hypothetical protein
LTASRFLVVGEFEFRPHLHALGFGAFAASTNITLRIPRMIVATTLKKLKIAAAMAHRKVAF